VYLLFPLKFKFEMAVAPEPAPLAIGFAGGFQLGDDNDPVFSAYAQVLLFSLRLFSSTY
jgi:hypothetical protein